MNSEEEKFTIRQASRILGISNQAVRHYVTLGKLPSCDKNSKGRRLITLEALERYHEYRTRKKKFNLAAAEVKS